jgi:two-component system chemotaxis response regulator CheB
MDLAAAVLVVLHTSSGASSVLGSILHRVGPLPAATAVDGEPLEPGRIYVAPADHHLTIRDGRVVLSRGPKENGHRPAIDPLFRSAVRNAGGCVIGVVLSGTLDDGASGLAAIARHGGAALVQDPADALYANMPQAALESVPGALVAPAPKLGALIGGLVAGNPEKPAATAGAGDHALLAHEVAIAELDMEELNDPDRPGVPAGLGCPDCHGSLFAVQDGTMTRFRCRVGHAWSPESLLDRQNTALEAALWIALRTMEEKAVLHRRMAQAATDRGAEHVADWNIQSSQEISASARLIRDLLADGPRGRP